MTKNNPKSRKNDLVIQDLENEILVYDLKTNQAFCLNQTSSLVWQFCDGKNSIADISDLVSQELKMLVSEDFVLLALNELNKNNLLEKDAQFEKSFAGFNRREMIKRVGLASMIALPIISSVVAPTAANAQSGANGCSVTFPCGSTTCCPNQACKPLLGGILGCCDSPQVCGNACCSLGTTCVSTIFSSCCPNSQYCAPSNTCCTANGTTCTLDGCCPTTNVCGSLCCAPGVRCAPNGGCCSPGIPGCP